MIQMAQVWQAKEQYNDAITLLDICRNSLCCTNKRKTNKSTNIKHLEDLMAELHYVKCGCYIENSIQYREKGKTEEALEQMNNAYQSINEILKTMGKVYPCYEHFN
eukprot:UN30445